MPAFSAAPEVDFDGARGAIQTDNLSGFKNLSVQEFTIPTPGEGITVNGIILEPRQEPSVPAKDSDTAPTSGTKRLRITDTGVATEVPVMEVDGKTYSKFKPLDNFRHIAWCHGQEGQYYRVCFTYKFYPSYGGHNHFHNVPGFTWQNSTSTVPVRTCSPVVPVNKDVHWLLTAPAFATRVEDKTEFYGACGSTYYDTTDIKIDGLVSLPPAWSDGLHGGATYYTLIGTTTHHPINHFGKPQTISLIKEIAWQYHREFPGAEVLNINDISLKWGGLFDVRMDSSNIHVPWVTPHDFHRYGRQADLRLWSIPASNQARLKKISCDLGVEVELHKNNTKLDPIEAAIWENTDFNAPPWKSLTAEELDARIPHYHLVFPKYDSDVDNPVDQAPGGCPSKSTHR